MGMDAHRSVDCRRMAGIDALPKQGSPVQCAVIAGRGIDYGSNFSTEENTGNSAHAVSAFSALPGLVRNPATATGSSSGKRPRRNDHVQLELLYSALLRPLGPSGTRGLADPACPG